MFEYIQLGNIAYDNLSEEQAAKVAELALEQDRAADFVMITDGDESLVRAVNLGEIITPESLIDTIEDSDIQEVTVIVSTDLPGHDFFIDNAVEVTGGMYPPDHVCKMSSDHIREMK